MIEKTTYPTWEELTHGETTTEEQLLIQAIAILSTQPAYEQLTPWEVYDKIVDQHRVL